MSYTEPSLFLKLSLVFGSFGYAKMSLYDHHLSLSLVLSVLLVSVSVDSSLSDKDICYYSKISLHRNFFHIKCIRGSDWLQCQLSRGQQV